MNRKRRLGTGAGLIAVAVSAASVRVPPTTTGDQEGVAKVIVGVDTHPDEQVADSHPFD